MDDKMDFAPSDQAHRLRTASTAGYGLHQHHADQWLHSPVLGSTHQNQYTPLSFPPSSHQPAGSHPQQHQSFHQHQTNIMVMEQLQDHSHQPPAVITSGFNGQFIDPSSCPQPMIQASTPQSSAAQYPLDREQYLDQQFLQIQEARMKSFECFQQLLQLQYQASMEQMRRFNEMFSLCCAAVIHTISAQQTFDQQQPVPTVALSQSSTFQTASERQQQQSMDQVIIPTPTVCDHYHYHHQQQTQESGNPIAIPTLYDGSNENDFEHTQQNEQPAVVFKSYDVGSLREALITIDKCRSISIKCNIRNFAASADAVKYSTTFNCVYEPKFVQHLLDRNGHQMDSRSGQTLVSNDVFKWMINYGEIKIKAPHPYHHI